MVIDKLYMLWMGIWIRLHAVTTTLISPNPRCGKWEVHWNLWYLLNTKWYCQEMVEALNHMEWFLLSLQTYKRWLTTFICFWWGYGSVFMPLPSFLLVVLWGRCMSWVAIWKATCVAGAHLSWLSTSKTCSTGERGDWQSPRWSPAWRISFRWWRPSYYSLPKISAFWRARWR